MGGVDLSEQGNGTLTGAGPRSQTAARSRQVGRRRARQSPADQEELRRRLRELQSAGQTGADVTAEVREALPLVGGVPTIGAPPPPPPPPSDSTSAPAPTSGTSRPRGDGDRPDRDRDRGGRGRSVPRPRPNPRRGARPRPRNVPRAKPRN